MRKNKNKIPENAKSFKVIKRKLQNRKDGKKVYSYYNDTDKVKAKRTDWVANEDIKKNIKRIYGKGWKDIFYEGVKDIKKEESKEIKIEDTKIANTIEEYREESGFANEFHEPTKKEIAFIFNQGITTELETNLKNPLMGNNLIKIGDKYYLPTEKNVIEFRHYVNQLTEWFFDYLKENFSKKSMKDFNKGKISPAIQFCNYRFINENYPNLFIFDIDKTLITDDIPYMSAEFLKEKKRLQKIYFSNFKTVNIYNYIDKNGKIKEQKATKKRKAKKRKK